MSSKRSSRNQAKSKPSPEQVPGVGTSRKDEIIVVLGRAGSGKSTFVQMATSVPQEISNNNSSLKATTTSVNVVRAKASNGDEESGDRTVIIDTPGVENDILLDQPMFVEVGEKTKTKPPVRIAGIIYFIRIEHHTPPTAISAAFSSINQFRGQFPNRFDKMVVFALWKAGNHPDEDRAYVDVERAVDSERKKRETMALITSKDWDMTVESAVAILNEFKHMPTQDTNGRISILQRILALLKKLLGEKQKSRETPRDFVVVVIGSKTSGKAKFVDGLLSASAKTQRAVKTKRRITTQVEGRRIAIINIDLSPKVDHKSLVRSFKRRIGKANTAAILLFRQGSQVDHLEHLETALTEFAGDGWQAKTRIIDTTPDGIQVHKNH
ncbi:hypothetical protein PTI98_013410 [Pleurotus ostreatus]|nr:hypothetical protein PTI98_013410 [Pleurotus ostreatus]